jgi:hypothetical protein
MKKHPMKNSLCIGNVALLLFSCAEHNLPCLSVPQLWKQKITKELSFGDRICDPNDKIGIQFFDVKDSRCPKDVQCIQAGKVVVALNIIEDDKILFSFEIGDQEPVKEIEVQGKVYIFNLLKVEPYPEHSTPVKLSKYRIQLEVTPKD